MKKTFLLFVLLLSSLSRAQNFYATAVNIYDPPYGLVAQLWNPGPDTITVDSWDVSGQPDGTFHVISWGMGLSNLEQPGCAPEDVYVKDTIPGPVTPTVNVRVTKQPCLVNGQPYTTMNYTHTNFKNVKQCWYLSCKAEGPIVLPPGFGVTVYTAQFFSMTDWVHGFPGYVGVNFYFHK